jgi:hypothetical protein
MNEMIWGLVSRFHEIEKNVTRMTTNKKNKVTIRTIQGRQGATNVAVNAEKNIGCTM